MKGGSEVSCTKLFALIRGSCFFKYWFSFCDSDLILEEQATIVGTAAEVARSDLPTPTLTPDMASRS